MPTSLFGSKEKKRQPDALEGTPLGAQQEAAGAATPSDESEAPIIGQDAEAPPDLTAGEAEARLADSETPPHWARDERNVTAFMERVADAAFKAGVPASEYRALMTEALGTDDLVTLTLSGKEALELVRNKFAAWAEALRPEPAADPEPEADAGLTSGQLTSGLLYAKATSLARTLRGFSADLSVSLESIAEAAVQAGVYPGITTLARAYIVLLNALERGIPATVGLAHITPTTSKLKDDNGNPIGKVTRLNDSIHLMLALVLASGELEGFTPKTNEITVQRRGLPAYTVRVQGSGDKAIRAALRKALRDMFDDVLLFGIRYLTPSGEGTVQVS